MAATVVPGTFNFTDTNTTQTTTTKSSAMDKDAFLQLLVTELKYQDPLDPVDNKDFLGQMATFSSLEQMQNLNDSFEKLASSSQLQQAAALIGKTVIYTESGSTDQFIGSVTSVTRDGSTVYLNVGSEKVTLDQVTVIK